MKSLPDIAVMLLRLDGHQNISDVSPEVCRQQGYGRDELVGQSLFKFVTPQSRQQIMARLQFRSIVGNMRHLRVDVVCKDGTRLPVRVSTRRELNADGQQVGALVTMINVDEDPAEEEARQQQASDLMDSYKSLREFSLVTEVQLRQPLGMLESFATMIDSKTRASLQPAGIEHLNSLHAQLGVFATTLDNMATLTAPAGAHAELMEVDLSIMLARTIKRLENRLEQLACQVVIEGDYPIIRLQNEQLSLVLYNLLDNALRYRSPEREPAIHIMGSFKDGEVSLSVANNGQTIEASQRETLFELLKLKHNMQDHYKGVGLGVCRRIMNELGGTIELEPEAGLGARFTLRFRDQSPSLVDSSS